MALPVMSCNDAPAREFRGVVGIPQRAGIDADGAELRLFRLAHRPGLQLGKARRTVFGEQVLLRRLHVRIAGAAPPDVAARVGGLGADLRHGLAGGFLRHRHAHAGGALEGRHHRAAPFFLHRAVDR